MEALVEREVALSVLQAALGRGQVALVAGEAGIGKTRLLRALVEAHTSSAAETGPVWWGACDALDTPHPLAPLLDIARESATPFAAALAGPRPALFEAVLEALRSAPRPVLVVIEDAHWADEATMDLLKFLGRRVARTRALIVVSYRDDEVTASHPLRRVIGELPPDALIRVPLARLTPAGVQQLAQQMGCRADGVHALTRGNAFFVTEVLRDTTEPRGAVPATVQDVVLARFARLPLRAHALLRAVAVMPGRADCWLVDRLVAPTLDEIEAALASGLLVAESDHLAYRHELGRVAVETALPVPAAQDLHRRVLAARWRPSRHPHPNMQPAAGHP
jgi:predicted ATPase